jgi:hypothetical protein
MMFGSDMMMGPWTALHWVVFAIFAALVIYPTGRILQRMGFSPFWSVIALIPFANLVGLWIVAIVSWPYSREVNGPDGTRASRAVWVPYAGAALTAQLPATTFRGSPLMNASMLPSVVSMMREIAASVL